MGQYFSCRSRSWRWGIHGDKNKNKNQKNNNIHININTQIKLLTHNQSLRMFALPLLSLLSLLPLSQAAETILGVYIFSRHGDRTPKSLPPANLTELGYREIFESGTYFRDRYVASSATSRIAGLNSDIVKLSQIAVSAPVDNVIQNSAQGFLQGLYPAVGPTLGQATLRNATVVQAPLNGYQLIPIQTVASGSGSEDSAWLQGAANCAKALISSNAYYTSSEYKGLLSSTMDFYKSLTPVVNATFSSGDISFRNAYTSMFPNALDLSPPIESLTIVCSI